MDTTDRQHESTENGADETDHPLPELLDSVLNGDSDRARADGWDVKADGTMVVLSTYEEPPEEGGSLFIRTRIPIDEWVEEGED